MSPSTWSEIGRWDLFTGETKGSSTVLPTTLLGLYTPQLKVSPLEDGHPLSSVCPPVVYVTSEKEIVGLTRLRESTQKEGESHYPIVQFIHSRVCDKKSGITDHLGPILCVSYSKLVYR